MRSSMTEELEGKLKPLQSMAEIREAAEQTPALQDGVRESMREPINLLKSVFARLSLHDEPVRVSEPASSTEIDELWECMQVIDSSLRRDDTTQAKIQDKDAFKKFLDHACVRQHYFF